MAKRILFTGKSLAMLENLMVHMPRDYQKSKCSPQESKLLKAIDQYRPNVIVVGLLAETRESIFPFGILKDWNEYANIPIIVVGNEVDCGLFRKMVFQKHMEIFIRPLKMDEFTKKVNEFITLSEKNIQNADIKPNIKPVIRQEAKPAIRQEAKPAIRPEVKPETEIKKKTTIGAVPAKETKENDMYLPGSTLQEQAVMERTIRKKYNIPESVRKTILVVDDDVRMLNAIKMHLQRLYDVTIVPSGKLALRFLEKKNADLVLLDYMMPEQDGVEVLREIRENSPCPNIPVIFLTGVSDREKVMMGLELRPDGYLLKPVEPSVLLEKVTEVILGL